MKYLLLLSAQWLLLVVYGSTVLAGSKDGEPCYSGSNAIKINTPVERIVYQRNNQNKAFVPVRGTAAEGMKYVEVRLVARQAGQGVTTGWHKIKITGKQSVFSGMVEASGGWYRLEIRGGGKKFAEVTATVERIGVGEVFIAVGHSVAQGGEINTDGAADDRVSTVALDEKNERFDKQYLTTGDPQYLPEPVFVQAATGVAQAPFGHGSYFWSKFAELTAQKENVPVLIYNAAFGGTNLDHWAKAAQGIQFEHGFVRSKIRMPYINLFNAFSKYISLTGVRALLADHGQNDAGEKDPQKIVNNYKIFMAQARKDLGFAELALVVNRQHPENAPAVRQAQELMLKEPYSFAGPDYDKDMNASDKYDGIHLSASGVEKAAVLWSQVLTPEFFHQSKPYLPSFK